jgi:hypothetical protein
MRMRAPIRRLVSSSGVECFAMPRIHLLGFVLPKDIKVTLGRSPYVVAKNEPLNLQMEITLQIADSIVNGVVDLNQFELDKHFDVVRNQVQDLADAMMNLLTIKSGNGLSIVLDQIIQPSGKLSPIHLKEKELTRHITAFDESNFEQVALIVMKDRSLHLALRDFTEGMRQSYIGTIGIARAVDGFCQAFVPAGKKRDAGWEPMREALNASEDYVKAISKISTGPRHADWGDLGEIETRKIVERAWILMNRFLEYRKRGNQPLPLSEFPLLV